MMRPFGLGLAVALMFGGLVAAGAAAAAPKDTSAADVPPLIQQANVPCTVTATRFIDKGDLADGASASFYEAACQEGMGYVLIKRSKAPLVQTIDCLQASQPGPDGKPSKLICKLPANANPAATLAPNLTKAGRPCTIDKAKALGSTPTQSVYEVSCQGGQDVVLLVGHSANDPTVATPCFGYDEHGGAVKCTLTTPEQRIAAIDQLSKQGAKPCTVTGRHFIGTTASHDDLLEVSCSEGKGYMLEADNTGKLKSQIDCAEATGVGGGCTLTDARAAQTEQSGVYTRLAKKAGFNCDVSKYAAFAVDKPGLDVVELQCSNRPDGGVGIFPATGVGHVLDCLRSQTEGYKCSYTKDAALYPALDAQLKALGKTSCAVSGARGVGRTAQGEEFVEVACADGGPGWVLDYPANADQPGSTLNCAQAERLGGCQLPTNMKH
jgi:hypothetical protein